jgi:hypothetical protein
VSLCSVPVWARNDVVTGSIRSRSAKHLPASWGRSVDLLAESWSSVSQSAAAIVALCLLICSFPSRSRAASASLPAATEDPWVEVRTPRFRVLSNAGEPTAIQVAHHLERLAEVLRGTTSGLRDSGQETRVYVFRDQTSFRPYLPYPEQVKDHIAGYETSGPDMQLIAYHLDPGPPSTLVVSHEYLHAVMERSVGRLPVWANEGIAEYYSTFEASGRQGKVGKSVLEYAGLLRQGMMPLDELFGTGYNSPDYTGARGGILYATSWALVHMLSLGDPGGSERFDHFISELGLGVSSKDALREIYGPNAADSISAALRVYVAQGRSYMEYQFPGGFEALAFHSRVLSRLEVLELLGELLARSEVTRALAREHLESAWRSDSSRALPCALLFELANKAGDRAAADHWLGALRASRDRDPRARGLAGEALVRDALRRANLGWPGTGPGSDQLEARRLLRYALESRPEAPEWLVPFALTYVEDGPDSTGIEQGIRALYFAQDCWPRRPDIFGGLSILMTRAGHRRSALRAYQNIPPGEDQAYWKYQAGKLLCVAAEGDAKDLARRGQAKAADSIITMVCEQVKESGVAKECSRFKEWLAKTGMREMMSDGSPQLAKPPAETAKISARTAAAVSEASSGREQAFVSIERALASGDYQTAEDLIAGMHRPAQASKSHLAHLDSLEAHARSLRRMSGADGLARAGQTQGACALYTLILGDRPPAALRREVEKKKLRLCGP